MFSAGVASMRGAPLPLVDDAPVTSKWRDQMQAAKDKLRASYAGPGPYTVARVLADVTHWHGIATRYADDAKTVPMAPARLKVARDNALNLLEAQAQLKIRRPEEIVDAKDGRVYLDAMTAPIDWLIDVGTPILERKEDEGSWYKRAAYIGLGLVAIYGLSKLLSSGAELTREMRGLRPPDQLVRNPPAWAADPILYEQARASVEPQRDAYENPDAVVVHVYKQLGGRVS